MNCVLPGKKQPGYLLEKGYYYYQINFAKLVCLAICFHGANRCILRSLQCQQGITLHLSPSLYIFCHNCHLNNCGFLVIFYTHLHAMTCFRTLLDCMFNFSVNISFERGLKCSRLLYMQPKKLMLKSYFSFVFFFHPKSYGNFDSKLCYMHFEITGNPCNLIGSKPLSV